MSRMIRKQVYLDAELDRALSVLAAARGVTQAEIVRQALSDLLIGGPESGRAAAVSRLQALWDESDSLGVGSDPARDRWTREELHERPGDARRERDGLCGRLGEPA